LMLAGPQASDCNRMLEALERGSHAAMDAGWW
jgi:hypothetical protein